MTRRADPKPISDINLRFALEYLANGENALRAYQACHPKAKDSTAGVEGHKTLKKPEVAAFIKQERAARAKRLRMDGDEALVAITNLARGNIRGLFNGNKLKPINEWPDDALDCVKAIKPTPFGTALTFHDKLRARELMAVAGGKLRQKVDHTHKFDHAAYLADKPPDGDDDDDQT